MFLQPPRRGRPAPGQMHFVGRFSPLPQNSRIKMKLPNSCSPLYLPAHPNHGYKQEGRTELSEGEILASGCWAVGCKHSNERERTTSDRFRFYFTFKPQTKAWLKVKYPAGLVA